MKNSGADIYIDQDRFHIFIAQNDTKTVFYHFKSILKNSRFRRAILAMDISLGQSASHSASLVQLQNPSESIFLTIAKARCVTSIRP
jgi:hypothetical protein